MESPRVNKYRVLYRHPRTGSAGLVFLPAVSDIAAESARLEALGYVVTCVLRPNGGEPQLSPASQPLRPPDLESFGHDASKSATKNP
jgi:hypothetical protein